MRARVYGGSGSRRITALHEAAQPVSGEYTRRVVKNARVLADALLERGF